MAEIAEGYIHLKPFRLHRNADVLGEAILSETSEIASSIYPFRVEIKVDIEEGSIRVWATVAVSLYTAISVYPQFKDGARELFQDGLYFARKTIEYVDRQLKPSSSQIFRAERRTKTAGKIYRISKRIEKLEKHYDSLNADVREQEAASIQAELDKLLGSLNVDDSAFLNEKIHIPGRRHRHKPTQKRVAIKPEQLRLLSPETITEDEARRLLFSKKILSHPKYIDDNDDNPDPPANILIR
ncbi:hypothetical protein [Xanthobacter variabilis]|uniref:hypothetical protein n=1 Tax=Xanthobacter variabilis TaxID=3119932 RepID=UPI00374E3B44